MGDSIIEYSIFDACRLGNISYVRNYMSKGNRINIKNSEGETPFFVACKYFKKELCDYLFLKIPKLSDLSIKDNEGRTVLFRVIERGCPECILEWLLDHGASGDLCKVNNKGVTPLSIACQNNYLHLVKILCEFNENFNALLTTNIKDKYGKSALYYAYTNYIINNKSDIFNYFFNIISTTNLIKEINDFSAILEYEKKTDTEKYDINKLLIISFFNKLKQKKYVNDRRRVVLLKTR